MKIQGDNLSVEDLMGAISNYMIVKKGLIATLSADGMARHVDQIYFAPLFNYHATRLSQTGDFAYFPDSKRFLSVREFAANQTGLLEAAHEAGFRTQDFLDASYGICTAVRNNTFVIDAQGNLMKCYKDVGQAERASGHAATGMRRTQQLLKWMVYRDSPGRGVQGVPLSAGVPRRVHQAVAPRRAQGSHLHAAEVQLGGACGSVFPCAGSLKLDPAGCNH